MEILIIHQSFIDGDAIGHDIQGMYDVCTKNQYNVFVFCEFNSANPLYTTITLGELKKKISIKENILIYHHSIFWELGEGVLENAECNVVIRYHNITPPIFFEKYSEKYAEATTQGRKQTERLAKAYNFFWLSDSHYNNNEIINYGVSETKCVVMPPFHKVDLMDEFIEDSNLLYHLSNNSRINVLFIGRVVTNKGHKHICRVAKSYVELYGDKITFWIVGGRDAEIGRYYEELNEYISKWGLEQNVIFTDKVSMNSLKSYILGSDVFLCLSEHEGFCVPIIESQYYKLPIVACDSSAVTETIGEEQVVFTKFDEDSIATAIHIIATNPEISNFLVERGQENYYSRFTNNIIERKFEDILNKFK